ncbi:hypothetical protein L2E82_18399 [Cichorium intybus]|uniref:Uncharacterized protein n=1 Tax=Cichorium intybus TaxID=13427 RepID=A0ACB9F9Z7_CICIN|nr:hypothetical protein L2E82_18399 [Cichorium intybus]
MYDRDERRGQNIVVKGITRSERNEKKDQEKGSVIRYEGNRRQNFSCADAVRGTCADNKEVLSSCVEKNHKTSAAQRKRISIDLEIPTDVSQNDVEDFEEQHDAEEFEVIKTDHVLIDRYTSKRITRSQTKKNLFRSEKTHTQTIGEIMTEDSSSSVGVSSRINEIGELCGFTKGRGLKIGGIQMMNLRKGAITKTQ